MDSKNSEIVDSVRNMAISRRGGVRTRGGRLPPISLRDISQVTGTPSKKLVAPRIPQRRKVIKEESGTIKTEHQVGRREPRNDIQNPRGRGRGRQFKAFLQTEGSFLAEGPAAKTKKDPLSYESFSFRSFSRSSASESIDAKYDVDTLKTLLNLDEDAEVYEDDDCVKPPHRLPLQRERRHIKREPQETKIKKESEIKKERAIKKEKMAENVEMVKIKKEIKSDGDDEEDEVPDRGFVRIKKEILSESGDSDSSGGEAEERKSVKAEMDSESKVRSSAHEFQDVEGTGKMILLQIPRFTVAPEAKTSEGSSKNQGSETEPVKMSTFLGHMEEGRVGKLRIMKSGRMKMALGSVEFEMSDGNLLDSCFEAVSLRMRDGGGGDLAVLGRLDRKMILSPVVDILLTKDDGCKE